MTGPDSGGGTSEVPGGWPAIIARLVAGEDLDAEQARFALGDVLEGSAGEARLAGLLVGLAAKGPSPTELEAMVDAMLDAAVPLVLSDPHSTTDIVGTGGSPRRREAALNVSTMAAFVAAGAGAVVCKHGNRRASSTSGSFDLLDELGVTVELDADGVRRCVDEAGIGFAFARVFHPAMRHAAPVRTALGVPTVFNVLGPLAHPGGVTRSVIGVGAPSLAPLMIDVLARRGSPRAMVVCGHDGTDEIVTTGTTRIHELRDGEVRVYDFDPASVGIAVVEAAQVQGGDPVRNATIARELFAGAGGPVADMVALNAAAVLVVAGRADSIADGLELARAALADGAASRRLETLVALLNP
jgi:anthranilate phosphoribosyltransferase